jgi:SAM-dependent methyltransferase
MGTTDVHYRTHLGPVYTWMVGDPEAAFARSRRELDDLRLPAHGGGVAIDLGAGFGLHSLPLAERGYTVRAIDSCESLLDELRLRSAALPIEAIVGDLCAFKTHVPQEVDVILCMGDTLTHLPSFSAVDSLLDSVAGCLRPGGMFAATFRDYATKALQGDDRFIPVRADDNRILTCFLEYGAERVIVHDLIHQKEQGQWQQRVSSYFKLRLPPQRVVERLTQLGLVTRLEAGMSGMVRVVGVRS